MDRIRDKYEEVKKRFDGRHMDTISHSDYCLLVDVLDMQADEIKQISAERDAAIADINMLSDCRLCKHIENKPNHYPCSECFGKPGKFEYRGLPYSTAEDLGPCHGCKYDVSADFVDDPCSFSGTCEHHGQYVKKYSTAEGNSR